MKKGKETERKILGVALELFVKKGYYNTSIDAITSALGLTKGALYTHFKSKRELVLKLIDDFETNILDRLVSELDGLSGNAIEKLQYTTRFLAEIGQHTQLGERAQFLIAFQLFVASELKSDPDFEPVLTALFKKHQKVTSDLYRQGVNEGLLREDIDPDLAGSIFLAFGSGLFQQWLMYRPFKSSDQYIQTIHKILLEGVRN
jgi:AcrR family transcriptional regulator